MGHDLVVRLLGGGAAAAVALVFAVLVIGDAVLSLAGVLGAAGWVGLVVLAFPLFMAVAVWRGWGTPNY